LPYCRVCTTHRFLLGVRHRLFRHLTWRNQLKSWKSSRHISTVWTEMSIKTVSTSNTVSVYVCTHTHHTLAPLTRACAHAHISRVCIVLSLIATNWKTGFNFCLFKAFYPHFKVNYLNIGRSVSFYGKYTLKVVGGGNTYKRMRKFSAEEIRLYNSFNQRFAFFLTCCKWKYLLYYSLGYRFWTLLHLWQLIHHWLHYVFHFQLKDIVGASFGNN